MTKQLLLFMLLVLLTFSGKSQENRCWAINYHVWNNNGRPALYINCGNDDAFNAAKEITIELWARAYTFAENRKILGKIAYHEPIDNGYVLGFENLHVYAEYFNPTLQQVPRPNDGPITPDSSYAHLVTSYSSITGEIKNYVNGILVGETTIFPSDSIVNNNAPFIIGNAPWDTMSYQFYGNLDEVRVWNQFRTQEEIQQNMHVQLNGDENGLVAYYNFNEANGANVPDNSLNHFDGILTNYDHISTSWGISGAPVGNEIMSTMQDVDAIWYRNTENYHRMITDHGLTIIGSIPEKNFTKYLVAGHNGETGVTNANSPTINPAGFQRTEREWYVNCAGNFRGSLTMTLADAAIEAGFPTNAEVENYALLYRSSESEAYTSIRTPTSPFGGILQFNDLFFENGYYALGYSTEEFEIQEPNTIDNLAFEELVLAPNPVNSTLIVNGIPRNTQLFIYNICGVLKYQNNLMGNCNKLDMSMLIGGVYIVKLQHKNQIYIKQIIKNQ